MAPPHQMPAWFPQQSLQHPGQDRAQQIPSHRLL